MIRRPIGSQWSDLRHPDVGARYGDVYTSHCISLPRHQSVEVLAVYVQKGGVNLIVIVIYRPGSLPARLVTGWLCVLSWVRHHRRASRVNVCTGCDRRGCEHTSWWPNISLYKQFQWQHPWMRPSTTRDRTDPWSRSPTRWRHHEQLSWHRGRRWAAHLLRSFIDISRDITTGCNVRRSICFTNNHES